MYNTLTKVHVWIVLLSALLEELTNEIDIKCITWGLMNLCMLDGKTGSCSQWFLPHLIWRRRNLLLAGY